jgi:SAM-dependent methyltransferase
MSEPRDVSVTRAAYDLVADDYAELLRAELANKPLDRALLNAFAELALANGVGPVADLGCGPGRVTEYLHALGVTVFGVDLSPAMIAVARRTHPGIRFDEGSMTELGLSDGVLGGIVAWYSIIHTPPERLGAMFAEFQRMLAPGGHLLIAFQVGDDCAHLEHAYGHDISLDAYRLSPDGIAELLDRAGLVVHTRVVREPDGPERTPQGYLLARKSAERL